MNGEAVREPQMATIRERVKTYARQGWTLEQIEKWMSSNGYLNLERELGMILARHELRIDD
jgi:hypothetical protein